MLSTKLKFSFISLFFCNCLTGMDVANKVMMGLKDSKYIQYFYQLDMNDLSYKALQALSLSQRNALNELSYETRRKRCIKC